MRQYIIKQINSRILNEDQTANLEYPVWKRRAVIVTGYAALRLWSLGALSLVPVVVLFGTALYLLEAIKKILIGMPVYVIEALGTSYRNLVNDTRSSMNVWNGTYGLQRPEMKIKNPNGMPTPIVGE